MRSLSLTAQPFNRMVYSVVALEVGSPLVTYALPFSSSLAISGMAQEQFSVMYLQGLTVTSMTKLNLGHSRNLVTLLLVDNLCKTLQLSSDGLVVALLAMHEVGLIGLGQTGRGL